MTMVLRAQGAFTLAGLPVLSRDPSLGFGAKFATNVHDQWAFAAQAAVASGTDNLLNLADDGATQAVITAPTTFTTPAGGMGFGNSTTDVITLPSVAEIANDGTNTTGEGLYIFWLKSDAVQTAADVGVAGWVDSGALGVFEWRYQSATTTPLLVVTAAHHAGGSSVLTDNGPLGAVHQYALSFELVAGVYNIKMFKDGIQIGATKTSAVGAIPLPSANPAVTVGKTPTGDQWAGQFYRTTFDDLSAETPETIIARDFAAFDGQFA